MSCLQATGSKGLFSGILGLENKKGPGKPLLEPCQALKIQDSTSSASSRSSLWRQMNQQGKKRVQTAQASPPLCPGFILEDEELAGFGKPQGKGFLREIQLFVRKSQTWAMGAAGTVKQQGVSAWPECPQPQKTRKSHQNKSIATANGLLPGREGRREAGDPSASGRSQQENQHRPREREDLSGFEPEEISPVFLAFP